MKIVAYKILIIFMCILSVFLTACKETTIGMLSVTEVVLASEYVTLNVGDEFKLEYNIYPFNAYNQNVYWTTSNVLVAEVNEGVVNALNVGVCYVYVITEDGYKEDYAVIHIT